MWRKNLVRSRPGRLVTWGEKTNTNLIIFFSRLRQGTQNFGGIRVGNGPTEDEAEIIQHDQLSQHSEEEPEVRETQSIYSHLNNSVTQSQVETGSSCFPLLH